MNDLDKAISLSKWKLSPSSYLVYLSMWSSFEQRLLNVAQTPLSAKPVQLLNAIKQAGQYATQKRLFALYATIIRILKRTDPTLVDHSRELRRLFLRDIRPDIIPLNYNQLKSLAHSARGHVSSWKGLRLGAVLIILSETGIRNNELLELKLEDFSVTPSPVLRVASKNSERYFALSEEAVAIISDWLENYPGDKKNTSHLFISNRLGHPLDSSTLWRQINRIAHKELGLAAKGIGVSKIRASVANKLLSEGVSSTEIQQFLGHRQEVSTAELLSRIHSE